MQAAVGASYRDSPAGGNAARGLHARNRRSGAKAFCRQMCGSRPRVNILDNATGQAKMGELVGVLGPSGAPNCSRLPRSV